jgi:quercetin dioxygenase-like cupin family protein
MSEQINRRHFNNVSLASVLALAAASHGTASFAASDGAKIIAAGRHHAARRSATFLVEVNYPPGTGSPAHQHANGVMAYVVSGSIASKVGDAPEQTYRAGEAWWEPVGAIHRVSRNASATEPATLLAIYIAPTGATAEQLMKPM